MQCFQETETISDAFCLHIYKKYDQTATDENTVHKSNKQKAALDLPTSNDRLRKFISASSFDISATDGTRLLTEPTTS